MKKTIAMLLVLCLTAAVTACGGQASSGTESAGTEPAGTESAASEWTRSGYFTDENDNMCSVTWMEDISDEPGWYVSFMNGEDVMADSYGGIIPQEGDSLHGELANSGENAPIVVTVTEEGEKGLMVVVEGGETYHFTEMEFPEATIFVNINVEGWGNIAYTEGEETPEIDPEYPFQSAVINLAEPATHTILAWPKTGNRFVKWTKNGEDFSTEPQITLLLDESAEYIAVFEEDPDYVSPVEQFVGVYQCDRAHASVEASGFEDASIMIEWAASASETVRWYIFDHMDPETLTIEYENCPQQLVVYDENGEIVSEETQREDCSGTITFADGTFTWHFDQSDYDEDKVFEKLPDSGEGED